MPYANLAGVFNENSSDRRGGSNRLVRAASYVIYHAVASRLPRSFAPGGGLGRRLRGATAARMVDRAGQGINVESGAYFGSGKGLVIGDRSGIGIDADIHGPVTIGTDVMMGPRCTILTRNHRIDDVTVPMNTQSFAGYRPVVIEDDVWIGANVTIMPGVRVGTGTVIAAGAVVAGDVQPFSIVGGVPARIIRSRLTDESVTERRPAL